MHQDGLIPGAISFAFPVAIAREGASRAGEKTSAVTVDVNRAITPQRPSGAIWSSAHDMAAYLRMELAEGNLPDGRRYMSKENLLARHAPQVASGEDTAYGMGLVLETQSGVKIAQHGGATFPADTTASAKLAPRYVHPKLGEIVVVVNKQGTVFDFGEWKSAVASCKNESGTTSFRPAEPGMPDFMEFAAEEREGKRVLVAHDLESEQVFVEK